MTSKRAGTLAALLVTAALLCAMPGLLQALTLGDGNRMDERLRPARLRPLTVWLLPDEMDDRRLIASLCTAFEKQHPGVRIFLRSVAAEEWRQEDAVLPDVALFSTGNVSEPERLLLPLNGLGDRALSCASSAGQCYGAALWLSPSVLAMPAEWFSQAAQTALLGAAQPETPALLSPEAAPWDRLLGTDGLALPQGVMLQQLLLCCPRSLRPALSAWAQPDAPRARVLALKQYRKQQNLTACVLSPAVCQQVRYAGLCRDGDDARAFLAFLMDDANRVQAVPHGFLPVGAAAEGDELTKALSMAYQRAIMPNAFAHTAQELQSLCLDAFRRGQDPVETLLRLQ